MFRKKIINIVVLISGILKFVNGKTCKFYPSYPEYGAVYSVECYLGCCPIKFPKTAKTACCDRSLSWLWIVLPCLTGLSVLAIIVIAVCMFLITRKNKIEPRIINVEAAQSYDTETILTKNEISNYADRFIINPTPTYQVQTQDQVMPYLPNNTLISNRSYFIENEIIY